MKILDAEQVEHFLTRGFVRIPACFDRQLAEEWRALAFERLGYDAGDPETWAESRVHLGERIEAPDEKPRADQKDDGDRHLSCDEQPSLSDASQALVHFPGSRSSAARKVPTGHPKRRQESGKHRNGHGDQ